MDWLLSPAALAVLGLVFGSFLLGISTLKLNRAPASFVEAAVNRTTHAITIDGKRFVMATRASPTSGSIASIWGDLARFRKSARASLKTTLTRGCFSRMSRKAFRPPARSAPAKRAAKYMLPRWFLER